MNEPVVKYSSRSSGCDLRLGDVLHEQRLRDVAATLPATPFAELRSR